MCLGVPGRIVAIDEGGLTATVDFFGVRRVVRLELVDQPVAAGDYVLNHVGYAAAELLGIDPLLIANEGKAVIGVRPERADAVFAALRADPLGRDSAIVGACSSELPGSIVIDTGLGRRLLAEPDGELLPRIC